MSLKLFEFTVTNTRTKETAAYNGRGASVAEAWVSARLDRSPVAAVELVMFRFETLNSLTGERAAWLGQGDTMDAAMKESLSLLSESFRPSTSGAKRPQNTTAVTLPDGRRVSRTLAAFEGDEPYEMPVAPAA